MAAAAELPRRAVVEGIGTAFLVAVVIGSGIMVRGVRDEVERRVRALVEREGWA